MQGPGANYLQNAGSLPTGGTDLYDSGDEGAREGTTLKLISHIQ